MKLCLFYPFLSLLFVATACTDLSKVERKSEKDPLEAEPAVIPEEPVKVVVEKENELKEEGDAIEAPAETAVAETLPPEGDKYPFARIIEDINGRAIDVQVLAKQGAKIGFQLSGSIQRFIMPIVKLSEKDQVFLNELDDGGNFDVIEKAILKATELAGRSATWHREIVRAEKEAEVLKIPRLTALLIENDSLSESIEKEILYTTEFRNWAGRTFVLCLIRIEPQGSRMAMTDEKAANRKAAKSYGVRNRPAIMVNVPGDGANFAVPLANVKTADDLIREIQIVLDDPGKIKHYIESKDGVE